MGEGAGLVGARVGRARDPWVSDGAARNVWVSGGAASPIAAATARHPKLSRRTCRRCLRRIPAIREAGGGSAAEIIAARNRRSISSMAPQTLLASAIRCGFASGPFSGV